MQKLLHSYKAQCIVFLFIWLVSMVLSAEFVLSVSMFALVIFAFFELEVEGPKINLRLRSTLRDNFRDYTRYRAWLVVSVPFLIVLISAFWSSDLDYTLERLRIKLPFLVLPFAFASMPPVRKREILTILYFLLVMMTIISLYVFIEFLVNFEPIMDSIGRGGHLPTPSNHIRFSLTLAIAIVGGMALWMEKFHLRKPFERIAIGLMTLFLFVFIHLLSVRSGILALYLSLVVLGGYYIIFRKMYLAGLVGILLIGSLPYIAYRSIPSFQLKVDYAVWDYKQFRQGTGAHYPDAERLVSMQTGLKIAAEHPWFGVGAGDLKRHVRAHYEDELNGKYHFRMPHNQLISVAAGTGALGLIAFLGGFFFPLFYRQNFRQPLFLAFHAVIFMSFLMENTIENNFGVSLYLFFLLIALNYLSNKSKLHYPA